jgi:L,D-peptidoglycan transpeptidase YkuD (ErfK/YbiS/YcfS/YnhG family)
MSGTDARPRALRLRQAVVLGLAALFLAAALAGCSDDAPPETPDAVTGKTPVVRPEDVNVRGTGGAAVLAPDYRQGLTADLPAEAEKKPSRPAAVAAAGPAGPRTAPPVSGPAGSPSVAGPPAVAMTTSPAAALGGRPGDTAGLASGRPENPLPAVPSPAAAASGRSPSSAGFPVPGCRQLVLVVAPSFEADRGTLRRFERQGPDGPWIEAGAPSPCVLGRKGLGAGRGLTPPLAGPAKRQGDGRTPAGLFTLPVAFGYADAQAARTVGVRLPYVAVTDRTACVTDPASDLFGRVVGPEARPAGLRGQDRMVRDDRANVWGLGIGHNLDHPDAGAGSCLFVNVRPAGGPPTGGSIGCPETVAASLAAWLDPAAGPLLAVLPAQAYQERQTAWGLP